MGINPTATMRSTAAQTLRILRPGAATIPSSPSSHPVLQTLRPAAATIQQTQQPCRRLHTTPRCLSASKPPRRGPINPPTPATSKIRAHNAEPVPETAPPTDFSKLDVLGSTPPPANSVDMCTDDGFGLGNGARVFDGDGVLLVGGEAFLWRPWEDKNGRHRRLVNAKGQLELEADAFDLLGLVWPRPDLLVLGLGRQMRPLSPESKRHITSLGMRVEILDTFNAASQFNMLATERGAGEIAAALIPIGWTEGAGS